jgi:peroxiredoxin Q/BCP
MTTTTPAVGAKAPPFALESDAGSQTSLGDFAGRWLVLYFYPRDNTPGCTVEAQDFTQAVPRLQKLQAAVVGVSKDSIKSHGSFRDKFKITFPLLSDPDLVAHKAYGAWGKKMMYGKEIEGALRSTFLIHPDGTLARAWSGVKVNGHAGAVVDAIAAFVAPASGGDAASLPAPKGPSVKKASRRVAAKKGPAKKAVAKRAVARKAPPKAKKTAAKKGATKAKKKARS